MLFKDTPCSSYHPTHCCGHPVLVQLPAPATQHSLRMSQPPFPSPATSLVSVPTHLQVHPAGPSPPNSVAYSPPIGLSSSKQHPEDESPLTLHADNATIHIQPFPSATPIHTSLSTMPPPHPTWTHVVHPTLTVCVLFLTLSDSRLCKVSAKSIVRHRRSRTRPAVSMMSHLSTQIRTTGPAHICACLSLSSQVPSTCSKLTCHPPLLTKSPPLLHVVLCSYLIWLLYQDGKEKDNSLCSFVPGGDAAVPCWEIWALAC